MRKLFIAAALLLGLFAMPATSPVEAQRGIKFRNLANGTADAPALHFASDTNLGLYRISADVIGMSAAGVEVTRWVAGGIGNVNGTANAPSFFFTSDTDNGGYLIGANNPAFAAAGAKVFDFNSDLMTIDTPVIFETIREDFNYSIPLVVEEDFTANVVTDASENLILLGNSQLGYIHFRYEAPDGPGYGGSVSPMTNGNLRLADFVDDVTNEGVVLVFGSPAGPDGPNGSFHENFGTNMYCEAQIDIADISDTDDFWFGWIVKEAYDNPPASATYNTSALFTITDTAGDLDIVTQLNAGGELADDAGTDWTDGDQFILRVGLLADSVTFEAELTDAGSTVETITQTNAVLDMDDADEAFCVMGLTLAANSDPIILVNYVEIGEIQ